MSKKVFVLFLFLILSLSAWSQKVTVSSDIAIRNDYAYSILGKVEDNILLFRDKVFKFEVQAFNEDLQQKWERPLDLGKRKVRVLGTSVDRDRFGVFYGLRKKNDYSVFVNNYDSRVNFLDSMLVYTFEDRILSPKLRFKESENKKMIVLYNSDRDSEFEVVVYDKENKRTLYGGKLKTKSFSKRDFRSIILTNRGELVLVLEKDNSRAQRKNHSFEFVQFNANGEQQAGATLGMSNLLSYHVKFKYDNRNQRLVGGGLYTEKNLGYAKGYYSLVFDANSSEGGSIITNEFSEELLSNVQGKETVNKNGLTDFNVQDIVLKNDGGPLLIVELNKEYSRRPNYPSRRDVSYGSGRWVDYYYEDILVLSIFPSGKEHWTKVLHKRQFSQDDDALYSSYFLFKNPSGIRFVYNDEIRNDNSVSEYIINGNGRVTRRAVMSTEYQKLKLRFRDAVQIDNNECIVPSERNSRLNLVKITY